MEISHIIENYPHQNEYMCVCGGGVKSPKFQGLFVTTAYISLSRDLVVPCGIKFIKGTRRMLV